MGNCLATLAIKWMNQSERVDVPKETQEVLCMQRSNMTQKEKTSYC